MLLHGGSAYSVEDESGLLTMITRTAGPDRTGRLELSGKPRRYALRESFQKSYVPMLMGLNANPSIFACRTVVHFG